MTERFLQQALNAVSVYVHIPYCVQKCGYCDFNSYAGAQRSEQEGYVQALCDEVMLWARRPEMAHTMIDTLFIGGGTPTLLPGRLLANFIAHVRSCFALAAGAEVTVEANPGTIDVEDGKLWLLREAGVNRLSFGVQAYQPHLLERLGRIHTPCQVETAVEAARTAGFVNINLDLMYGLPGQTAQDFEATLRWALALQPSHVSTYSLIVEEGTPFYIAHEAGQLLLPAEEQEEAMFWAGKAALEAAGFEQYEISNFALPGFRCRHNQVYWRNEPYLGLGCGAHSFLELAAPLPNLGVERVRLSASRVQGGMHVKTAPGQAGQRYRFWNLKTPLAYRHALAGGVLPVEGGEALAPALEMAETMIMGLRLLDGVAEERFAQRFGRQVEDVYGNVLERLQRAGLLERQKGRISLSARGQRVGNRVWAAFLPA